AREVAEPAHQRDRLGTGCWRQSGFSRLARCGRLKKRCRLKQRHDQQSCATGAGRVGGIEVTIIEGIAERVAAIHYDGLPAEAVRWAKAAILDTVGVTLAGAAEPCARIA